MVGQKKLDLSFDLSVVSVVSSVVAAPVAMTKPRQEAVAVTVAICPVTSVMSSIATMISPIGVVTIRVMASIGVVAIRVMAISRMSPVQMMHIIPSTEERTKPCFPKH